MSDKKENKVEEVQVAAEQKTDVSQMSVIEIKAALFDCQETLRRNAIRVVDPVNKTISVLVAELTKKLTEEAQATEDSKE